MRGIKNKYININKSKSTLAQLYNPLVQKKKIFGLCSV